MCGIAGITRRNAGVISDLLRALKNLEYRGYDSAGIAVSLNGEILVRKGVGTIDQVIGGDPLEDGEVGIGHTRWATHGGVSVENAHPHTSCDGRIALVHNGTLDGFEELREELMARGHSFRSDTDTEVIVHLVEEGIRGGMDPVSALASALGRLGGSYAVAMIVAGMHSIFLARYKSPLVIGLGRGENYCASDVAALLHLTREFIFLEDGELAELTPESIRVWRLMEGRLLEVEKTVERVEWVPQQMDKGSYEHFMLKEIWEQPHILRKIAETVEYYRKFSEKLRLALEGGWLSIVAAGTSLHAGMIGKYYLSRISGLRSEVIIASEFPDWSHHLGEGDVVLAISQSGETADVLEAVRIARRKGARIFSIVNVPGSTLTRLSEDHVFIQAGPEVGVAATKTFTAQVATLYVVSSLISDPDSGADLRRDLEEVSRVILDSMEGLVEEAKDLSKVMKLRRDAFFLGRGVNYPTALEGALKLKEISYIHAEGYAAGEYKHGPLALIEEGVPVIAVIPTETALMSKIVYNLMEVRARGAFTVTIQPPEVSLPSDRRICVDVKDELTSPIVYAVPLQLIAYYTALELGRNPDKPRNLAKSVTVE
ncbi:MAG: glutamine--fructose-6-phosphate transaminase (isomerizing) [Candidatus Korarchaeota archaeon NZ13-K]|nr:MAG: glutamine--fructose-6-phosphate transaminase (isomerizing) [Candidatus Korarchaeota archaeon NZ13-K]